MFWNRCLNMTTTRVKYWSPLFIKKVCEATFSFPNVMLKATLNHVDAVESSASYMRFNTVVSPVDWKVDWFPCSMQGQVVQFLIWHRNWESGAACKWVSVTSANKNVTNVFTTLESYRRKVLKNISATTDWMSRTRSHACEWCKQF